jgi:hypothetical protein
MEMQDKPTVPGLLISYNIIFWIGQDRIMRTNTYGDSYGPAEQNRTELTATAHITALNFTALHVTKISSTVDISLSASRLFRIQGSGYS